LIDKDFYKNIGPFSLDEIASKVDASVHGNGDKKILDIASLEDASETEISFYNSVKYRHHLEKTKAGVLVVDKSFKIKPENEYLVVDDPYVAIAKIASMFYPDCEYQSFYFDKDDLINSSEKPKKCSQNVFIHKSSRIGKNCEIGSFVKIGPGVTIGDNCLIGDNVSIYYAKISHNVKIFQGVKIGGEGFGFIAKKDFFKKIPQLGRVIIRENVQIGCNSTLDRGSIGDTIISKNTMIDNLVHIAHNVKIGENSIIAAMTGISGSTEIGKNAMIGGQVGISGHVRIGDNVKIAAKSGIMKDIPNNSNIGGYPAENLIDWHRGTIFIKKNR
tara:strand:+ start:2220 stop:3209 length:990 start_codon:yes stop_codon:yes gene_type:complete